MPIDFDSETAGVASMLNEVDGSLKYEKIILYNIKNHVENGINDEGIVTYLLKLSDWFGKKNRKQSE